LAAAKELGISSKLGLGILLAAATMVGPAPVHRYEEAASAVVAPPLSSREKEKAWLDEFLNQGQAGMYSL